MASLISSNYLEFSEFYKYDPILFKFPEIYYFLENFRKLEHKQVLFKQMALNKQALYTIALK